MHKSQLSVCGLTGFFVSERSFCSTTTPQKKQSEKKDSYNKKYKELYGYYPDQYGNNADWENEIYLDEKIIE